MSAKREMNGWLKKRPNKGNIGQAHRRWFVLESPTLSWYTSELEHDQKGFGTLTKYSSVAQLESGGQLGPNFEVTVNSEQIFVAEAASSEQATEWVLCINGCIQRLKHGAAAAASSPSPSSSSSSSSMGSLSASEMEQKLMEQAIAETRRMEQMQAQHRLRQESSAKSQAERDALENAARQAQETAQSAAEQLDSLRARHASALEEQSAEFQARIQALQEQLDAQQNESLQTMESTLVEMEDMQAKLSSAEARVAELEASAGSSGAAPEGMVSAEELEMAAAAIQQENDEKIKQLDAKHAAQVEKMTKERAILIREVKKLQKAVKDTNSSGGGADPAEVEALRLELAEKDAQLAQKAEEVEALISMQAEQETLSDASGQVAEALKKAEVEHQADIEARGREMQAALQRQADSFNVERAGHQAAIEELRANHASMKESMQRQLDALQQTGSSQGKRAQQAIAAEKAMQEAMMEYDARLRESQTAMEAQAAELAAVRAEAESLRAESAANAEALARATAKVDAAEARTDELASELQSVRKEHAEAMEAVLQGQAADVAQAEATAAAAAEDKAAAAATAAELQAKVEALEAAAAAVEAGQGAAAQQAELQVATLEREVANLNEQLNQVEGELDTSQQALADAKAAHESKESDAISREMDLKARVSELESKAAERASAEADRIEGEVALKAQVDEAEARAAAAEKRASGLTEEVAGLQHSHAAEIATLEAKVAAATASVSGELAEQQEEAIYIAIQGLQEEHEVATAQLKEEHAAALAEQETKIAAAKAEAKAAADEAAKLLQEAQSEAAAAADGAQARAAAEASLGTARQELVDLQAQISASATANEANEASISQLKEQLAEAAAAAEAASASTVDAQTLADAHAAAKEWQEKHDAAQLALSEQADAQAEAAAAAVAEAEAKIKIQLGEMEAQNQAAQAALAEARAKAEAAHAQEQADAASSASADGTTFTQADVDAAVAKKLAEKEAAHKKELMTVRVQAAKRLAASPRAGAAAEPGAGTAAPEAMETLQKEIASLKEEATKVAGVRQREKLVLVQEIRRNRTTLEEKDASIKALEADLTAAKKTIEAKEEELAAATAQAAAASASAASSGAEDPNAARLAALSKDLSAQLDAATSRADTAQSTIELQHAEIKRLKARVASLEAEITRKEADWKLAMEEVADAASTSPRNNSSSGVGKGMSSLGDDERSEDLEDYEDESSAPGSPAGKSSKRASQRHGGLVSPALRRVKRTATPQSAHSLASESSFGTSQFDTDSHVDDDDDEDSYSAGSPGVDSPRTRLAPRTGGAATDYAADNEDEDATGADLPYEEEDRLAEMEDEMVNWLHDHGFGDFEAGILDLGVEMMDDLKLLGQEDLEDIGMSPEVSEEFMYTVGSRFKVGQRIKIVNLTKAQIFNGLTGYVTDTIKDARYTIKLDQPPKGSSQTLVSCFPTNLVAVDGPPSNESAGSAKPVTASSDPAASTTMVARNQSSPRRSPPSNADQKSRLISEAVSPSDTLKMVRNPGTFSRTTAPGSELLVSLSQTEWTEVDCADHPPPRCSLDSPLIQQILQSWTRSSERLDKMNAWLRAIMRGAFSDPAFSWGIEIAELTPEVANGFLTVLLPLVVIRAPMLVNVYVRLSHPPGERHYQPTIDLRLSLNGWQQVDCSMNPAPKCDVLSPLIQNLLECWTSNRDRLRRMNDWLQTVMVGRFDDENFMDGIEMLELAPEIVQGFLTMLVPLIQARAPVKVKVYLRQALKSAYITLQQKNQNLLDLLEPEHSEGVLMDLRLSVTPRDYHYTP